MKDWWIIMRDLIESFGGMKMKIRTVVYKDLCIVENWNVADLGPLKLLSKRIKRTLIKLIASFIFIRMLKV